MLIDARRVIEHKYRDVFPHLQLTVFKEVAIPFSKIDVEVLGEMVKPIPPITEYLLRFVDLGLNNVEKLADALGISSNLCLELVADEIRGGNLFVSSASSEDLSITLSGKETLRTCLASIPKVTSRSYLFDCTDMWNIASHPLSYFMTKKDLSNQGIDAPKLVKARASTIEIADLNVVELNRRSRGVIKNEKFEIQQIRKILKRRHGFILAQLLVYFDGEKKSDFLIDIDGVRQIGHENWLRKNGGLSSIGIEFESLNSAEKDLVTVQIAETNPVLIQETEPDGGIVAPYEFPYYLKEALEVTKKRLLIFSPWVKTGVVNDDFRDRIEKLLKSKVEVTIGWGFGTDRDSEKSKNHSSALRRLLKLSNQYNNLNFIKFDESHAKILIYDDIYIASSFNWLSWPGDKNRVELGEKRTHKNVVDSRYEYMLGLLKSRGQKMNKELIPDDPKFNR